mgnify:FL=1
MTNAEIQLAITSAGEGAKAYRLVQERAGALHFVPSLDKPPLSLSPFEQAVVPPGPYGVAYVDAAGKEFVRARPINVVVESLFPVVRESALAPIEKEAAAVGPSLEAEQLSADTLGGRGIAQAFHENLASYVAFQRALGTHSAAGLRIENERIEQIAKASRTMLDAQATMLERSMQLAEKNRSTPPPPPNWEEIIAAAAPALATMYTATIAAITKTAEVKVSGLAEPRAPESEKMSQSHEVLGNVASNERHEAMQKDEAKLAELLTSLRSLLNTQDAAKQKRPKPK